MGAELLNFEDFSGGSSNKGKGVLEKAMGLSDPIEPKEKVKNDIETDKLIKRINILDSKIFSQLKKEPTYINLVKDIHKKQNDISLLDVNNTFRNSDIQTVKRLFGELETLVDNYVFSQIKKKSNSFFESLSPEENQQLENRPNDSSSTSTVEWSMDSSKPTANTTSSSSTTEEADVKKVKVKVEGVNPSQIRLVITYLEFKSQQNSAVYSTLVQINENIKKDPNLGIHYNNFIQDYIFTPISEGTFNLDSSAILSKEKRKIEEKTGLILYRFKEEFADKNVDETFWGDSFNGMDDARKEISKIQGMSFDQMNDNRKSLLSIEFDGPTASDIKQALIEFRTNSSDDGRGKDVADFLSDSAIDDIAEQFKESEELFKDLHNELSYIFDFIDSNPNLTAEQKNQIANDIKSTIGLMHFINGLKEVEFKKITNYTVLTHLVENIAESSWIWGFIAGGGFAGLILSKKIMSLRAKSKFEKLLASKIKELEDSKPKITEGENQTESTSTDTESKKLSFFKRIYKYFNTGSTLGQLKLDDIKSLISEMEEINANEKTVIKGEYEPLTKHYERLKQLRDVLSIQENLYNSDGKERIFKGVVINKDTIFLTDKEFARTIISALEKSGDFTGTINKAANITQTIGRKYVGVGFIERIGDIIGYRPLLVAGNNNRYFEKETSAKNMLKNFIDKFKTFSDATTEMKLLKEHENITDAQKKGIDAVVDKTQERFINKNIIISEIIADKLSGPERHGPLNDEAREEIKNNKQKLTKKIFDTLENNQKLTKTALNNIDGDKGTYFVELGKLIIEKFKVEGKALGTGDGLIEKIKFFKFGENELEKLFREGEKQFADLNNTMKTDGKFDKAKIQNHILGELKANDTSLALEVTDLTKETFDGVKATKGKETQDTLKASKKTLLAENKKLPEDLRFGEAEINKLTTDTEVKQLTEIVKIVKGVNDNKVGLSATDKGTVESILKSNHSEISMNLSGDTNFKIDNRVTEMSYKSDTDVGEINSIKKIDTLFTDNLGKSWFTEDLQKAIQKTITNGLTMEETRGNRIDSTLKSLTRIGDLKIEDIYKGSKDNRVVDTDATEAKELKESLRLVNNLRTIIGLEEVKTLDGEPKATTDDQPKATTDEEPKATTDEEPKATTDEEPKATTDEEPKATTDEEPKATTDEEPKATTDEEPKATADEEPKATTDDQPKATADDQPKATADDQPKATADDQPKAHYTFEELKKKYSLIKNILKPLELELILNGQLDEAQVIHKAFSGINHDRDGLEKFLHEHREVTNFRDHFKKKYLGGEKIRGYTELSKLTEHFDFNKLNIDGINNFGSLIDAIRLTTDTNKIKQMGESLKKFKITR